MVLVMGEETNRDYWRPVMAVYRREAVACHVKWLANLLQGAEITVQALRCFKCSKTGHLAKVCPGVETGPPSGRMISFS